MNSSLRDVMLLRNEECVGSERWNRYNEKKAHLLEMQKSSLLEKIVCFEEADVEHIGFGYQPFMFPLSIPYFLEKRSLVEYHPTKRHPIPYVLLRNEDQVFLCHRKPGGGETRLHGKVGLPGGHVGEDDTLDSWLLGDILHNAMLRELEEEIDLKGSELTDTNIVGTIRIEKDDCNVEGDHLGFIYEVWVDTRTAIAKEEDVHDGEWVAISDLPQYVDRMENWMLAVYEHHLSKHLVGSL